jgi:S-adenosylmethionine synthetase
MHGQSADIALGTHTFGAGDQGLMFGYATNKTPNYMPPTIYYSHKIVEKLTAVRKSGATWLGPDAKSQVTIEFNDDYTINHIAKIVCSTQHSADTDIDTVREQVKAIILTVLPAELIIAETEFLINPTGRFVIGGPDGDTGLTGRKIIVDTYGGSCPHGGGAFSGKDPTKVDRSAAYMARYLAKNIVASGKATHAIVQLAYAIGVEQPMSVYVDSDGNNSELTEWIITNVDLTPKGIINKFDLFRPIYSSTTNYGHFGKLGLPWEELDLFKD